MISFRVGYNRFRRECWYGVDDFEGLVADGSVPRDLVDTLHLLYDDVDDIDLYVGGTIENIAPGDFLGPTFRCIIGDQFNRLKRGDR